MANNTTLNTPVLWINKYLQSKLGQKVGIIREDGSIEPIGIPFFPTMPSTIDSLTEQWITVTSESNPLTLERYPYAGVMATWDRMFKMNRSSFPHIKCEQILYYFYATQENAMLTMIKTQEEIFRLLDRGDESAEEINNWCSNRRIDLGGTEGPVDNMFFFHDFKVYQLEETRDIIDFGTARTYAGNKIIIDFDYHQMPELTNADWAPEPRLTGNDKITI
jgi:hypothetical protein